MSLESCIKGKGLSQPQEDKLLARSKTLQQDGITAADADRQAVREFGESLMQKHNNLRTTAGLPATVIPERPSIEDIDKQYEASKKEIADRYAKRVADAALTAPVSQAPLTIGEHVLDPELYKAIAGLVGEPALLKAARDYKADYAAHLSDSATHTDYEKHLVGLMQLMWNKRKAKVSMTQYDKQIKSVIDGIYDFLTDDATSYINAKKPNSEDVWPSQNVPGPGSNYDNMMRFIYNDENRILKHLFIDEEGNAYNQYKRHRDSNRLYQDIARDIEQNKFTYGYMPADWTKSMLQKLNQAKSAMLVDNMVYSEKSLTNIYAALKQTIDGEQIGGRPTPSDRQLASIQDMILNAYNEKVSPSTPYDAITYLDGRIGAGKTIMMNTLLRSLGRLEGGKDIGKIVLLAGDTAGVGLNLEKSMGIDQSAGKGTSAEDVTRFLSGADGPVNHEAVRFIVVDEAARGYEQIPALAQQLASFNGKHDVRVFLLGDQTQVSTETSNERIASNPDIHVATPLTTSFRNRVSSINNMQAEFQYGKDKDLTRTPLSYTSNVAEPWNATSVAAQNGILYGVSGSVPGASRLQQVNTAIQVMNNRQGTTTDKVIITNRDDTFKEWQDRIDNGAIPKDFRVINYYNAQGSTFDEVYVDLHIDPEDETIKFQNRLNTAIYTAARGRNYVYLINNAINTKEDAGLAGRIESNNESLQDNAKEQAAKVEGVSKHLAAITPSTLVKPPPAVTPQQKKDEEAGKQEPDNEPLRDPDEDPEDGTHNPDDNGVIPDTSPVGGTADRDPPGFTGSDVLHEVFTGEFITVGPDGNINVVLRYPTGATLHKYNNVSVDEKGNTIDPIVPQHGERIYIVPMRVQKGTPPKYGVFRHTGYQDVHQLLGVLGAGVKNGAAEEVQMLRTYIPEFAKFDDKQIAYNSEQEDPNYYGEEQVDTLSVAPDANSDKVMFYRFQVPPSATGSGFETLTGSKALPSVMKGSLLHSTELKYTYKDALESPVANPAANNYGLDWIDPAVTGQMVTAEGLPISPTGVEAGLLRVWYDKFYHNEPNPPPFEDIINGQAAKTEIVTIDDSRYRALTETIKGTKPPYSKKTVPVDKGDTFLRISFVKNAKPQFIKLKGAKLNNNSVAFHLHDTMYLKPMRDFISATNNMVTALNQFILGTGDNEMGEDKDAFEEMYNSNTYVAKDAEGNEYKFKRDNNTGFNNSSSVYNFIVKRLVNNNWEDSDYDHSKLAHQKPIIDFVNRFFTRLKETKRDHEFSMLAREVRKAQKAEVIGKEGKLTKEQAEQMKEDSIDPRPDAVVKYENGKEEFKVDLKSSRQQGDDTTFVYQYTGQVAMQNLAQANGYMVDPVTGKKYAILHFQARRGKEGMFIKTGYDMMEANFHSPRLTQQEGKEDPQTEYLTVLHKVYTDLGMTPLYVGVHKYSQFKRLLTYIINTGQYQFDQEHQQTLPPNQRYGNLDQLYQRVKAGDEVAEKEFYELMRYTVQNYNFSMPDATALNNIFGQDAFDENTGQHKTNLRVNVPLWLSSEKEKTGGVRWETAAQPESSNALKKVSPAERIGQMLTTNLEDVVPTTVGIKLDAKGVNVATKQSEPTQEEFAPPETDAEKVLDETSFTGNTEHPVEERPEPQAEEKGATAVPEEDEEEGTKKKGIDPDMFDIPDDEAFFSGTPQGQQLDTSEARKYLKKFVPGITDPQIHFLNRIQMLEQAGRNVWGRVKAGAVYFQTTTRDTIYSNVIKHEAFHTIFRYFTDATKRDKIINAAVQFYGLDFNDPGLVEEHLARQFDKREDVGLIPSIINSFFNWLRNLFGLINKHQYEIEEYFNKINRGAFTKQVAEPMMGEAFMVNLDKDWDNSYSLYRDAWGKFAHDFRRVELLGGTVLNDDNQKEVQFMQDDHIVNYLIRNYQTVSKLMNDAISLSGVKPEDRAKMAKLGINDDIKFALQKDIYNRLADKNILEDMINAHYKNRFNFKEVENRKEREQQIQKDNDYDEENEPVSPDQEIPVTDNSSEDHTLTATINKENDLKPYDSLTDKVKLFLQTITDEEGTPIPIQFSMYTLYHTIHGIPLNGDVTTAGSKKIVMDLLRDAFEQDMNVEKIPLTKEMESLVNSLRYLSKGFYTYKDAQRKDKFNEAITTLNGILKYYENAIQENKNPNVMYHMQHDMNQIAIVKDTIEKQAKLTPEDKSSQDNIVQSNLAKVAAMTDDFAQPEFIGSSFTKAVYDSFKQLIAAAYNTHYIVPGSWVREFKSDQMFIHDDAFMYQQQEIRRNKGEKIDTFMKRIMDRVLQFSNGKTKLDIYDMKAMWLKRKLYNQLADMMNVANNSYLTSPYRLETEIKNNEFKWNIQNIDNDTAKQLYGQSTMSTVQHLMLGEGPNNTVVYKPDAFRRTRDKIGTWTYATIDRADRDTKRAIAVQFLDELGLRTDVSYANYQLDVAVKATISVIANIERVLSSSIPPDNLDVKRDVFGDANAYLKAITAPVLDASNDRIMTSYRNGQGKNVSGVRSMSFANNVILQLSRLQSSKAGDNIRKYFERKMPYMFDPIPMKEKDRQVIYHLLNPLNPMGLFPGRTLKIGSQHLFDSHVSHDKNGGEFVTPYQEEDRREILSRLINGNFIAALNQPQLFPGRAERRVTTIQPFYVMSEKMRSEGVGMNLIPSSGNMAQLYIGQLLFQIINRPNPQYESEDGAKPFNNLGYKISYSPFEDTTVSSKDIATLRSRYESMIQSELARGGKSAVVKLFSEEFMKDEMVQKHISAIQQEFNQEAKNITEELLNRSRRESYYKERKVKGETVTSQNLYKDNAYRAPDQASLKGAYETLFNSGLLSKEDIESKSKGTDEEGNLVSMVTVDDRGRVTLNKYSANVNNFDVRPEHLLPLVESFAFNHFMRGYFLNQMVMGDNASFGSDVKITKRMGIAHGGGNGFFNIGNILRKHSDNMKFLVVDDIIKYRNLDRSITDNNYSRETYGKEQKIDEHTSKDELNSIINTLSGYSMLSKPQYNNLMAALRMVAGDNSDLMKEQMERFVKMNLNQVTENDSAAWVTERGHNMLRKVSGSGMNVQDIMKPLVMGRDRFGVERDVKCAMEVITDQMAIMFPPYLQLRIQADFGSLNRDAGVKNPNRLIDMYNRAKSLEEKRIRLLAKNENLKAEEEQELNRIYEDKDNDPAHFMVPPSAVKFNSPQPIEYDYEHEMYHNGNHTTSSFKVNMEDVRIQQKPVSDPSKGSVSLFTQLMYMSNVNGNNAKESSALLNSYSEIQRLAFDQLNQDYPLVTAFNQNSRKDMLSNLRSIAKLIEDKNEDNPTKMQELALIRSSIATLNDPSIVNDAYTQAMSLYSRLVSNHRFEGFKTTQVTPTMRRVTPAERSAAFARTGYELPQYDFDSMTAEVYLPDVYLNRMRKIFGKDMSEQQLIDMIPIAFGYRVPSTGLNSAVRIKIKGFYPSKVNAIIGPSEMHLIMGSDFDADAMFIVNPNYLDNDTISGGALRRLTQDKLDEVYRNFNREYKFTDKDKNNPPIGFDMVQRSERSKVGTITEMKPIAGFMDYVKGLYDNATGDEKRAYRAIYTATLDNDMLHQYVELLGKGVNREDATYNINFNPAKSIIDEDSLFNQRAFALNPDFQKRWTEARDKGQFLNETTLKDFEDERDKLLSSGTRVNTPLGYTKIQKDNMVGATMIGRLAQLTKTIAHMIYTVPKGGAITVTEDNAFTYDGGEPRTQMGRYNDAKGVYEIPIGDGKHGIFFTLQWMVNAALDAVKEGILHVMNLNMFTGNAWAGGLTMGLSEVQTQSFMNQPVIKEVSDFKRFQGAGKEKTIYTMQRELRMLDEIGSFKGMEAHEIDRLIKDHYRYIDEEVKGESGVGPTEFRNTIKDRIKDIQLTTAQTREYERFQTLRQAKDALSHSEFAKFVNYQLKVLETFEKMDNIGKGIVNIMFVQRIIQDPGISYQQYQRFLDNVYNMYDSRPEPEVITNVVDPEVARLRATDINNVRVNTYYRTLLDENGRDVNLDDPDNKPAVKKTFPIQGVNLFNLAHFRSSFKSYTHLQETARATFLKHSKAVENMAHVIAQQFHMSLDRQATVSIESIKDGIVSSLFGLLDYTNSEGESTALTAIGETYTSDQGREFTGAQAFIQRKIDEIRKDKKNDNYKNNEFIRRLKIEWGALGVQHITIQKLTNTEPEFIAGLMYQFKHLDDHLRAGKVDPYWFSKKQVEFYKLALLEYSLAYGATNFSQLLPTEIKTQVMNKMFHTFWQLVSQQPASQMTTKMDSEERPGEKEQVSTINLLNRSYPFFGLSIALNNPSSMPQFDWKDKQIYKQDIEDLVTEEEKDRQKEKEENIRYDKRAPVHLTYDPEEDVYYDLLLQSTVADSDNKPKLYEKYPLIVKDYNSTSGRTFLYMRVHQKQEGENYYRAWYTKLGSAENMKSIQIDPQSLVLGYDFTEMFPKGTPRFFKRDLVKGKPDTLTIDLKNTDYENTTLPVGQHIILADTGDYMMQTAKIYEVTATQPANQDSLDEIDNRIQQVRISDMSEQKARKQILALYDERKKYLPTHTIKNISGDNFGSMALKVYHQTLNPEVGNALMKTSIERLGVEGMEALRAELALKERGIDPTIMSDEEKIDAKKKLDEGKIIDCNGIL
jgi:hypothetical protein